MKPKYCGILIAFCILLLTACVKDEGNYSYGKQTDYFIDSTSVSTSFTLKQNEQLMVEPSLANGISENGLSYEWFLKQESFAVDPSTGGYYDVKIGTERQLNYKITEKPGSYILVLYTKDNNNGGITQLLKRQLTVSSFASPGWMVLHGDGTSSDISIVVNNRFTPAVPSSTDYVQENVFSLTNGKRIEGEGAGLFYLEDRWVEVFTKGDQGGYRVSNNDLRTMNPYSGMFVMPPAAPDIRYDAYASWSYNEMLVNKGDLYFASQPDVYKFYPYGVKCFGEDYTAAPFLASSNLYFTYYGVFYDTKNKRFLYIDYERKVKQFAAPGPNAAFDMRNIGKEMVYAEHGFDNRWFCLMQDAGAPSSRELFVSKFNNWDDGNRALERIDIGAAQGMAASTFFAFGNRGNIFFHADATHIYQNNYAGDKSSVLRLDVGGSFPGYQVTCMNVFKWRNHPNDGRLLMVALYDAAEKKGKLLQIDINEVSGVFGSIKEYDGFGKITAMNYKLK
ncbi:PKD-like family lipoprotein [Pseudoflavitalea rhizosphaerae]|uniref:PKD-like family lipoprotein n=1 Tax=Pseudoflavitalea rhizosphaerae TaxID=1884793 RepID=UPI000F8E557F|nr:PKD-like family lipoprotein [Pseudoflavitalea rhizosphaerae]